MPHAVARPARLTARLLARARAALPTALAAVVAAGAGAHAARTLAFGGALGAPLGAPLGGRPAGPLGSRVAGAAAGNVEAGLGAPGARGRTSSTFARLGGAARDEAPGLGRLDVVGGDRRSAAASVRRQLELGAAGTYIGELLLRRDSSLIRWPDRAGRPLAVFVGSGAGLTGWRPEYLRQVASAFSAWAGAGVPLRFHFVDDSTRADVHVAWTDRFAQPISGRTVWSRDARWWMVDANITLALHHNDGAPLDSEQVRAITLHEVGHLLGLDHTTDSSNVMAPRVRVRELSAADAATARLLYSVPAGRVR